jgi:hypothetical protein
MAPEIERGNLKGFGLSMAQTGQVAAIYFEKRHCLRSMHMDPVRLSLLLCLLALWPAVIRGTAFAQEPTHPDDLRIQQLRVQVMPEFDDPRVLVIVQGRLAAAANDFPVTVTFRLPQGAQINQMATINMESTGTTMLPYETQPDPADARWQLVTYSLDGAHFFYEYYYDPIAGDVDKAFTYTLNSYHPVGDASVEIQEPKGAEDFSTSPQAAASRLDQNLRLTYHQIVLGTLEAGQEASITVGYTKADPNPSLSWEQVMALQESKQSPETDGPIEASPGVPIPTEVFIFAGGALLILVGMFAGYRLRTGKRAASEDEPRQPCRMCGTTLKADASFCHQCGAMVQTASIQFEEEATATTGWQSRERR